MIEARGGVRAVVVVVVGEEFLEQYQLVEEQIAVVALIEEMKASPGTVYDY